MYKFDLEDYAGTYRNVCKTANELKNIGATIIKNDNGEVEVYFKNGTPYTNINNKQCCELLGYKFDIDTQKCNWKANSGLSCNDDCTKKVVFNSNKNKGTLFKINEGDTCTLDISFDYLLNFDCTLFKSNCSNNESEIKLIENELNETKRKYNILLNEAKFNSNILAQTQREFDNLQYVIKGTITNTSNTTTTNTTIRSIDTWKGGGIDFNEEIIPVVNNTDYNDGITPIVPIFVDNVKPNRTTETPWYTPNYSEPVLVEYDNQNIPKINTENTTSVPFYDSSKPYNVIMPLGLDYNTLNFKYDNNLTTNINGIDNQLPPTLFGFYLYGKSSGSGTNSIQTNSLLPKTYLLSNDGLLVWSKVLGSDNYKNFIDSYGCDEKQYTSNTFNTFISETIKTSSSNNKQISDYYVETTQGVCDKKNKNDELNSYKFKDTEYKKQLSELNTLINDLTNSLNNLKSTNIYGDTLKNLENIKVTFVLEHDNNDNKYSSVYEETLFNIGEGNMVNFINEKSPNTGIIISGATSDGILTPPYSWPSLMDTKSNTNYDCETNRDEFIKTLYLERYKGNYPEPTNSQEQIELTKKLNSWYNSTWVTYNISVPTDITEQIKNTKIRFSILVESCCIDLCLLIDKIEFNKTCQSVDNEEITITKPLGFEFEKVMDNKKSWVGNNDDPTREFDLTFRETQYDANDYKLILNTKEIELKIDGSNAIEEDILCSLQNNACLLTGSTFEITSVDIDKYIDFELIFLNTIPEEYQPYSGYSFDSTWTVIAKNNCEILYEDIFFTGSGNTLLGLIPTGESYIEILETIASTLNLDIIDNGSKTTFVDNTGLKFFINGFYVDIKLELTVTT